MAKRLMLIAATCVGLALPGCSPPARPAPDATATGVVIARSMTSTLTAAPTTMPTYTYEAALPATPTRVATERPSATLTATRFIPTLTPTPSPTPTPEGPAAIVEAKTLNVRAGPGIGHPVIASAKKGDRLAVTGHNGNLTWLEIVTPGGRKGWVSASLVRPNAAAKEVGPAASIPTPPPAPPTSVPASPPPPAGPATPALAYVVKSLRLRPIGHDIQGCDWGGHSIFVTVIDRAGNPLDGVRVHEVFTGVIHVTGSQGKGSGLAEYDIYAGGGGGGQLDIVDEAGNRIGELSRGMSAGWPDIDLMWDAGYCSCKPHADRASCEADLLNHTYSFAWGHYVYEVIFQRTH